jgi:hypothetical protein
VNLASIAKRTSSLGLVLLFSICGHAFAAPTDSGGAASTVKTIKNPGGGTIVYGRLSGQLTPQMALGETMKRVVADYGDRPQIGSALRNRAGTLWEGFFTVSNKKQGNVPMTGMVIVYTPASGTSGSATLIDTTANFPMSANSMLQSLVQAVTGNAKSAQTGPQGAPPSGPQSGPQKARENSPSPAAARAPPGPPERLTPVRFPDGTGSIGLPPGWTLVGAREGDVSAKGPNGEALRFGLAVQVLDPGFPQSRSLSGLARQGYVTVRYNQEPAEIFQEAVSQMNRKTRGQPPTLTIKQSRDLGGMTQGKNYMLYGDVDRHDGAGLQSLVVQVSISPPNPQFFGSYQMKVYQLTAPQQAMRKDLTDAIFASYKSNGAAITGIAVQRLGQIQEQDRVNEANFEQQMANTDLMSQGMSDLLRGESVFTDADTGRRYRGPDDLASALQNANPNRFQTVPLSQYIHGVDY